MPIFRSSKLLFIHIPKNAGRSIEKALLEGHSLPEGGRRNMLNRAATYFARQTRSRSASNLLIGTVDIALASQHLTFQEIELLGLIERPEIHSLTRFAVCRNPYDRAVSSVLHFSRKGDRQLNTPAEFTRALQIWLDRPLIDHNLRAHRRAQVEFVRDQSGQQAVNRVLRYEQLNTDFESLMQSIGRQDIALPWYGRSSRERGYRDYFDTAGRQLVESAFGEDLEAFKYEF